MDRIVRVIFSELLIGENTLQFQCKNGLEFMAKRIVENCDLTDWLSELLKSPRQVRNTITTLSNISASPIHDTGLVV